MQMVKKIFLSLLLFWVALLVFMPKEEIYFRLEKELAKQEIEINESAVEETLTGLVLKDSAIYVKGIKVATVDQITFFTVLFYTKVTVSGLQMDESLKNMVPERIETLVLTHTVVDPVHIKLFAEGSFGTVDGSISIKERTVHIDFIEAKEIGMIKSNLKQGEKGWYYETAF